MKGSFQISLPLKCGKRYYASKDYDVRFGGDFYLFLDPFEGTDGSRFFEIRFLDQQGEIEITGEGYIIPPDQLDRFKRAACREYSAEDIRYFIIGADGTVTKKLCEVTEADRKDFFESGPMATK